MLYLLQFLKLKDLECCKKEINRILTQKFNEQSNDYDFSFWLFHQRGKKNHYGQHGQWHIYKIWESVRKGMADPSSGISKTIYLGQESALSSHQLGALNKICCSQLRTMTPQFQCLQLPLQIWHKPLGWSPAISPIIPIYNPLQFRTCLEGLTNAIKGELLLRNVKNTCKAHAPPLSSNSIY